MQPLGPRAVFYLAAAVSDFFIPKDRLVKHKIQSSEEFSDYNSFADDHTNHLPPAARTEGKKLVIDLEPVPKFLKSLVDGWAPQGMIVSFKLETDPSILVAKARHSLEKYAHHLVIGNLLSTRKWEVVFVSPAGESWIRVPKHRRTRSVSGIPSLVGKAGGFSAAEHEMTDSPVDESSSVDDVDSFHHADALDGIAPVGEPALEIESLIIPSIAKMHQEHITRAGHGS
jgi:phosphopantothenate-cysteine ligase